MATKKKNTWQDKVMKQIAKYEQLSNKYDTAIENVNDNHCKMNDVIAAIEDILRESEEK